MEKYMMRAKKNPNPTLNVAGMNNVKWINNNLASDNEKDKDEFLKNIENYFTK